MVFDIANERCYDSARDCILSAGKGLFPEVIVLGPKVVPLRHLDEIDNQAKCVVMPPKDGIHHKARVELLPGKSLIAVMGIV